MKGLEINMTASLLKTYLVLNLMVVLSWLVLKVVRYLFDWKTGSFSYSLLNRLAQVLFLSSLVLPLIFFALPEKALPNFKIEVRAPLIESFSKPVQKNKNKNSHFTSSVVEEKLESGSTWFEIDIESFLVILLITGFLISVLRLFKQSLSLMRILNESLLIKRIGQVRISVSDQVKIPFSTRLGGRAHIVIPVELVPNRKDFKIIVQHELHHHRNGDTVWILLLELLQCSFYLNPFLFLWKKEVTEIQEYACDETLIRQMRVSLRDYSQCLVKVAEAARGFTFRQVGTTCMGAGPQSPQQLKSFLRRRIEMFRDYQNTRRQGVFGYFIGTVSVLTIAVCAFGAQKTMKNSSDLKPNGGVAKLDESVQKITTEILNRYVKKFGAKGGFVLVAESDSGKLLAVANSSQIKERKGKSWALSYEMEPASVMKGLIVASAVDQKLVKVEEMLNCENGKYDFGGHVYRDWKAFGDLRVSEVVMHSSNICGIKIGQHLGAKGLEGLLKQFGFGPEGTTSEFPEAMSGRYPKISDLKEEDYISLISTGYTATPGFYVTPLEVLQAYGAIANDGKLLKPKQSSDANNTAEVIRQAISPETASKIKSVLVDTVKNGTGKNAQSTLYQTAGKTSTAYRPDSPEHKTLGGERGIAGFVGFAPANKPKLVVYVGIIDPTNSADKNPHGSEHAAPVFKEVIETVLQKMKVEPDKSLTL